MKPWQYPLFMAEPSKPWLVHALIRDVYSIGEIWLCSPNTPNITLMSSSRNTNTQITTIEELQARQQAEKEEQEQKQREEDEAFEEECRRLVEEEERQKREEEMEWKKKLEEAEQEWIRQKELEKARKGKKRKVVETSQESEDKTEPTGSKNKKVSGQF